MASGPTHQFAGAVTGVIIVAVNDGLTTKIVYNPAVAGRISTNLGKLPDISESVLRNPHHRQLFHSVYFLSLATEGVKKINERQPRDDFEKALRGSLLIGDADITHLALNALTTCSLPLLRKLR